MKDIFWSKLIEDSKNLEEPVLYQDYFDTPFITEEDVFSLFNDVKAIQDNGFQDFRIYKGKGESKNFAYELFSTPATGRQNMQEWLHGYFGDQKFGIVVNKAEKYCESIARKLARFASPVFDHYPFPQYSSEIVIFIGNYGYTPLGIHYDFDYTRVLHFPIGPNDKKIIVWNEEENIKRITNGNLQYFCPENEIDELVTLYGQSYLLRKNDLFLLPAQRYHIG
ncbi:MAG: hypothetical protein ACKV1O_23585, partial [Saprospiraceae bacterium]